MHRSSWKRRESQACARFGTVRRPVSGRQRDKGGDDGEHPRLFLQVKHGKQNAREFKLWDEYAPVAAREGKVPAIILCGWQRSPDDDLVLCRISDLDKVAKEVVRGPQA